MKKPAARGDTPIPFDEYQFTLPEAAELARVPPGSVRNWMHRNIIQLGTKHFAGRWMFTVLDVLRLAVMHDLCVKMAINPLHAVPAAEMVVKLAVKLTERNAAGQLQRTESGNLPEYTVILSFDDDGKPLISAGREIQDKPHPPEMRSLHRAHIVIPVTSLLREVLLSIDAVAEQNTRAEAPVHV